ncbi:MAG: histidinol dehydrogenase, partial [Candidatus Poribacteria bacterium]|nr:histidinol dehydrogenase [Candidatus Poribacteria bacterium]
TMASVPAKVAGVEELVVCLAPGRDGKVHPAMLVAARECGVSEVYACGGAQAIAAMAYGSESIRRVDKIVGPGNPYSQFAKKEVFGVVDTDKIAGPSEILVIADESATPAFIAADLISQAEHSEDCSSILVTTSREIADATNVELERQAPTLPRAEVIRGSFAEFGAAFLVENLDAAVELTNRIAPEHAEVHTRDAFQLATRLRNVGGIFVGEWAPEALGDYVAGPNHILPTGGTARFSSAMGVSDFVKTSNLLAYSATALARLTETVVTLA